jgi:hypothetical protein
MQMTHADFNRSTAVRASLKRGLARQALAVAEQQGADLPALFALAAGLRPNPKGLERTAARLWSRAGVTRVALTACRKSLRFTARAVRQVEARVEGETAFHETGLIYVRAQVEMSGGQPGFRLCAVSFCCHALERLVERSDLPLDADFLSRIDAEAQSIFLGWDRAARIIDDGDEYYSAAVPGVWAGGHDGMTLDADWGLSTEAAPSVPIFSARTFLSASEMRPTVYLRWKNDPTCRIV